MMVRSVNSVVWMHTMLYLCTIFIVQEVAAYCDDDDDYCVRYIAPLY